MLRVNGSPWVPWLAIDESARLKEKRGEREASKTAFLDAPRECQKRNHSAAAAAATSHRSRSRDGGPPAVLPDDSFSVFSLSFDIDAPPSFDLAPSSPPHVSLDRPLFV